MVKQFWIKVIVINELDLSTFACVDKITLKAGVFFVFRNSRSVFS